MSGPIRFVYSVIWIAIGLSTIGTLRDCAAIVMEKAAEAQHETLSFGKLNRQLFKAYKTDETFP